jgi:predicted HNH restriction endonuclease
MVSIKKETLNSAILRYLEHLTTTDWISDEAYKFEFSNFIQHNVNFEMQTNEEILEILIKSQKIRYDSNSTGVQFVQKSGRKKLSIFLEIKDIQLFREFSKSNFEKIEWKNRSMSFTVLSVWLSSLFPQKIFPIPIIGFNYTINYLFETDLEKFSKKGEKYILSCQEYLEKTEEELKKFPFEEIHLNIWNKYFENNPDLNIKPKSRFEKVDWVWLVQDFHLFVHRNILGLYNMKKEKNTFIINDFEPVIEGKSKLAKHIRFERNNFLIKKIKENALKSNPMLNCEICGFSFYEKYGELGNGFIEAHHKTPLHESRETKTTKNDIALICSNCHRMIHKNFSDNKEVSIITVEELRNIMEKYSK